MEQAESVKLAGHKDCPYCGSSGKVIVLKQDNHNFPFDGYKIHCSGKCLYFTPLYHTEAEAWLWWDEQAEEAKNE